MLIPTQQALTGQHGRPDTAADKARLDQGKLALKKLLEKKRQTKTKKRTIWDYLRIYVSILAGLLIIFAVALFLFLVPMMIDPAWATLTYDFYTDPVVMYVQELRMLYGIKYIKWCSCTEGCTRDIFVCYQIIVSYKKLPHGKFVKSNFPGAGADTAESSIVVPDFGNITDFKLIDFYGPNQHLDDITVHVNDSVGSVIFKPVRSVDCDVCNATLLVNIKACGYPPMVNCTKFRSMYGMPGRSFIGYYSKVDPFVAMAEYDPQDLKKQLADSILGTFGFTALGVFILLILHAPYAKWCIAAGLMKREKQEQ